MYINENGRMSSVSELGLFDFAKQALGFGKLVDRIHRPICDDIVNLKERNQFWICPRAFFKSTIFKYALPLRLLFGGCNDKILIIEGFHRNVDETKNRLSGLYKLLGMNYDRRKLDNIDIRTLDEMVCRGFSQSQYDYIIVDDLFLGDIGESKTMDIYNKFIRFMNLCDSNAIPDRWSG